MLGDESFQLPTEREELSRLDLNVARFSLEAAGDLVEQILACGKATRFPFVPPRTITAAMPIALPTHRVCTAGLMNCVVS